jgi:hypothetical protein
VIRQAHTYLVGALGGATLIAIAIAAFVMLVSAQVFTDWPLAGLGKSSDNGVSAAEVVDAPDGGATAGAGAAATTARATSAAAKAGSGSAAGAKDGSAAAVTVDGSRDNAEAGGGETAAGGGGSGGGGSGNTPAAQTAPASSGGGNPTSPSGGGSGGGGSSTASSPSQTVTSTVNDTVTKVDQTATGGTLEKTGVTGVTEGVVDGVAGPESVVGQVVDGAVGTVEGILGGKR